ncbi:hypothetical protein D1007_43205 [Hordeum vulgare]|nr:hypothetical protein D1007_43205 [Hordeum vulgare]
MVASTTPTDVIDLNVTSGYSGASHTSDGTQRKHAPSFSTASFADARKLFDGMTDPTPTAEDPDCSSFMESVIFKGHGEAF